MSTEINCFKIHGLEQLEAEYRLYQLAGLRRDSAEFFANVQRIIDRLSRQMKAPVTTFERDGNTFLLAPTGYADPPDHITLVGAVATIRRTDETVKLSFVSNSSEWDAVRMRFLQFGFQNPLWKNPLLWQPGAGQPFFFKQPIKALGALELFEGFALRVMPHPEGGFGVVIDLRRKLVFRAPLAAKIRRDWDGRQPHQLSPHAVIQAGARVSGQSLTGRPRRVLSYQRPRATFRSSGALSPRRRHARGNRRTSPAPDNY
jgi:hypothetical protein